MSTLMYNLIFKIAYIIVQWNSNTIYVQEYQKLLDIKAILLCDERYLQVNPDNPY